MKYIIFVLPFLVSCGYSSVGTDMVGQVKRVMNKTPILCNDRVDLDLSLGVLRNGVGSMSSEDATATIHNPSDIELLKKAQEDGSAVKVTYNLKRWTWCEDERQVTKVEILK